MSGPLRVLLVEDSPTDAKLVLQAIRQTGHVVESVRVERAEAMRAELEARVPDVIVSDWSMPQFSALGALDVLKQSGLDVPFIIVSGTVGEELAVEAMRAGAQDYVLKDKLTRLAPAIERELRERDLRTERKRALGDLRTSEARFTRLFASGIIGTVIADNDGNIQEANDVFLRMIGFSREELAAGQVRWQELTPPEWHEVTDRCREELKASGVATPYEKEYERKDGARVPVLVGVAMLNESESIGFVVDLTAQKRAESALHHSEEQLRQAQKMEAVGRLAGGIAHDFNNLLSVILSYSAMMLDSLRAGDPIREDAGEIEKAGRRAADLTRQLLTFSRQTVTEPRVLDLNDLLADMDRMLQRILGEDVDLVFLKGALRGRVRVDPSHIEQVVMNLVVNARDAMPVGGKITIETESVILDPAHAQEHLGVAPGPYVMLAVTDTGCGMNRATQARIFEPFFTTKETGKGTGLGLSTVFGIVQQCHGTIWVYSELGVGTTFKVYLPRVDQEADATSVSLAPSTLSGSETILLVEDEDQLRVVAREILRKHGYQVIEARNAGEALLHCESQAGIHLLLTDVVMPQMSGPELARRLLQVRPGVKVLCMSGYTDDALVRHGALELGMAYLQKPITPEKLARKVRLVLDGGR